MINDNDFEFVSGVVPNIHTTLASSSPGVVRVTRIIKRLVHTVLAHKCLHHLHFWRCIHHRHSHCEKCYQWLFHPNCPLCWVFWTSSCQAANRRYRTLLDDTATVWNWPFGQRHGKFCWILLHREYDILLKSFAVGFDKIYHVFVQLVNSKQLRHRLTIFNPVC